MKNLRIQLLAATALGASFVVATTGAGAAGPASGPHAIPAHVAPSSFHQVAAQPATIGVELYVPPRSPSALRAFIAAASTPGTAAYHHYLRKGQFAPRFGATPATVATITRYLTSHGLTSVSVSADHLFVRARGSIAAVDRLFRTSIRQYRYKGKLVYANVTTARVPAALAGKVSTVVGLSDLPQYKPSYTLSHRASHDATTCSQMTAGTNATSGPFTISQVGGIYHYDAFATAGDLGQGQTLAVFELTNYLPSDIAYYQDCVGKQDTISGISVDGGGGISIGAEVEADLDIEIAATLAPKATLDVYQGPNSEAGVIDTYQRIATDDVAQVTTTSWGLCETVDAPAVTAEAGIFSEMATQGQTVVAASGDNGASDCLGYNGTAADPLAGAIGVDDPASQPYVTGVGGTTITNAATVGSNPASETVWDGQDREGSGGGISTVWPEPSYQVGVAGASSSGRTVPDVSIDGDPASGYMIYTIGYGWTSIGGTSAGAPMVATLLILANEYNNVHLGFVNPLLYSVGVLHPGVNFNDVSQGTNETFDVAGFSSAAVGYDAPSGWGSPIASSFLGGDI